ncbi:hypothetical protein evm_001019 [Chilo suppressalis]|nr:hypothetical protein evm_001019 [Chilo suppressalis]
MDGIGKMSHVEVRSRGPCFVVTLWPVLGFVAWGAPGVMTAILLATKGSAGDLDDTAIDAIRLCLLVFCLTVTAGCLIVYVRFRRRSAQFATLSAEVSGSPPDESTSLVENAEPVSNTPSISNNGCYGTITTTPSPNININSGCCSDDPNCQNGFMHSHDIEDIASGNTPPKDCACPPSQKPRCNAPEGSCSYLNELERAASQLGLLPPEQTRGRGGQLLKHTVLIIAYSLTMFIAHY